MIDIRVEKRPTFEIESEGSYSGDKEERPPDRDKEGSFLNPNATATRVP